MKQYQIIFYKNKKDNIGSDYYREFETTKDCIEWCDAIQNECRYYRYSYNTISIKEFLLKTK